jgi:ADP-heptose:LPS heptosyltransferase
MRIIVRREHSFGDVLDTTAIVTRLRSENPAAEIHFETYHQHVYRNNPDVNGVSNKIPHGPNDRYINLDMVYERTLRKSHPIDCYSQEAFGDQNTPHATTFHWKEEDARGLPNLQWDKVVVVHAARSWANRTFPREWWQDLINELTKRKLLVVTTGTKQDWDGLQNVVDLRDLRTEAQAAMISKASCFVASESGGTQLAFTTLTPIVALITTGSPAVCGGYDRNGQRDYRYFPMVANVPCHGCMMERTEPYTFFECRYGHNNCVRSFDIGAVADMVEKARSGPF